jgi:hypothetical protein
VVCAGLLEAADELCYVNDVGYKVRKPDIQVRFIHRTTEEFFTDTGEGREILGSDTSSFKKRLSALLRTTYLHGLAFRSSGPSERELFCLPLATVQTSTLARYFRDLRATFERKEWIEELDACQELQDQVIEFQTPIKLDFLCLTLRCGCKEYLEHVFNDPSRYTTAYKTYLLCVAVL